MEMFAMQPNIHHKIKKQEEKYMTTKKKSLRFRLADWLESKAFAVQGKKTSIQEERNFIKSYKSPEKTEEETQTEETENSTSSD